MKSQSTFEEIYRTYEKPIFNYILRMVRDRADAEDLTQEVFVKIYQGLSDFRGDAKLSTWIYRVATNLCLDHFKKKSFQLKKKTAPLEITNINDSTATIISQPLADKTSPPVDEAVIASDANRWLKYFLEQLPRDYRVIFILAELQELKNREIAEILKLSLETVKIRRHRARKKLKELLDACCTFHYDENDQIDWDEK